MTTDQQLIEAYNLIADYCRARLPRGFVVQMRFDSGKSTCELVAPNGEEIENIGSYDPNKIRACVEAAIDIRQNTPGF